MQPPKTNRLFNLALGLMILDGGFVIAIQIITFLLTYFFAQTPADLTNIEAFNGLGKETFILSIVSMLNLAVIIFKIASLANGFKPNNFECYKQALLRLPSLILLHMIGMFAFIFATMPLLKLLTSMFGISMVHIGNLLIFLTLMVIPYCIFACVFVIYEQKSPLQAITATYKAIRTKFNFNLFVTLYIMYAIPFVIKSFIPINMHASYLGLFTSLWFLFCHILTITVYADTVERKPIPKSKAEDNKTKVIIV